MVVQHCDGLLIESISADSCVTDLLYCCKFCLIVGTEDLWQSCSFVCQKLSIWGTYSSTCTLAHSHAHAVAMMPEVQTIKEVLSFLVMSNYCRTWISAYEERVSFEKIYLRASCTLADCTVKRHVVFSNVKQLLSNVPALSLPHYKLLFFLFVSERHGL